METKQGNKVLWVETLYMIFILNTLFVKDAQGLYSYRKENDIVRGVV